MNEEMKVPGFRKGVSGKNTHRGGTVENSDYLLPKENVQPVELESLKRVFKWLDTKRDDKLDWQEISEALLKLGLKQSREQIELWIWEVDDDLDNMVGMDEFLTMYQRCISDQTGCEPRNLFHLCQFLMYDKDFTGKISVEQTLQIIFVRHGREDLDKEIKEIFGEKQKKRRWSGIEDYLYPISCTGECKADKSEVDQEGGPKSCNINKVPLRFQH